jgi:hypothetical protein
VAEIGKKMTKNYFFWKSLMLYCIRSKNVLANFSYIFMNFNQVDHQNWFVCLVFWNLHALVYPKSVTFRECEHLWVIMSHCGEWSYDLKTGLYKIIALEVYFLMDHLIFLTLCCCINIHTTAVKWLLYLACLESCFAIREVISHSKIEFLHHAEGLVNPKVRAKQKAYWFWIPQSMYRAGPRQTPFFEYFYFNIS